MTSRSRSAALRLLSATAVAFFFMPLASATTVRSYKIHTAHAFPYDITTGPDGNLWYVQKRIAGVGRVTPSGTITEFDIDPTGTAIDTGPDGNLWVAAGGRVVKVTPQGKPTYYTCDCRVNDIVSGPGGKLWFADFNGKIGTVTTSGAFTFFDVDKIPRAITTGRDGHIWFTYGDDSVAEWIPGSGLAGAYSLRADDDSFDPYDITAGPDGNLWAVAQSGKSVAKITTAGKVTTYEFGSNSFGTLLSITPGPDGNVWFASDSNGIGRLTPNGTLTKYKDVPSTWSITSGPDGNIWVTQPEIDAIGEVILSSRTTGSTSTVPDDPDPAPRPAADDPRQGAAQSDDEDASDEADGSAKPTRSPKRSPTPSPTASEEGPDFGAAPFGGAIEEGGFPVLLVIGIVAALAVAGTGFMLLRNADAFYGLRRWMPWTRNRMS